LKTTRARISRAELEREPNAAWNAFVNLIAVTPTSELASEQRPAHLAFWYSSEVLNGGHLQYFANRGVSQVAATLEALREIGAHQHIPVLQAAFQSVQAHPLPALGSTAEFVAAALEAQFEQLDTAFGVISPTIEALLELHLQAHFSSFIQVAGGV
jgi:hypothetical protein